ncbi:uncharacterized protein C56G2.4-like [Physella acuta]|uniref:uncharacterized protein C56G2.4-like n=1 Tax=Physella acuta TaxID=109671 RepID=UPI0027DAB948|nr:uncharacterized protein C56G2.4-like [Physella acuta]
MTMWWHLAAVTLLVTFAALTNGHNTPCNVGNDTYCLQGVRDFLTRTTWWFGANYSAGCPDSKKDKVAACINPDTTKTTIISRLLQRDDFDVSSITQFLRMRFYVPAGSYISCGYKVNAPAVFMDVDLDSTHTIHTDTWTLQRRPAITWKPEAGAVYTLMAYDVGQMMLGGLWVNIRGGDSALGAELYPHVGPMNALDRLNFHVYALFKQSGDIDESRYGFIQGEIANYITQNKLIYRISHLKAIVPQIGDPMAIGLIGVKADPYGVAKMKTRNIINNCPLLINQLRPRLQTIVNVHNLTNGAAVNLELEVEVTYTSDEIVFSSCCRNISEMARTIYLNPLSETLIAPLYVRKPPFVKFNAVNTLNSIFFLDSMYTLLLLDVTAALATPGSMDATLLWFIMDIKGQYPSSGMEHVPYISPSPPLNRYNISQYVFLVFKQNGSLMMNFNLQSYCQGASPCKLNLNKMVTDFGLVLSGVNWFQSLPDSYTRMKLYENNPSNMNSACAGVSGYTNPCPDKCKLSTAAPPTTTTKNNRSNLLMANTILVLLSLFLVYRCIQ